MEHPVKRVELSPLPVANVIYSPPHQVLFIENGQSSEVGETVAGSLVVFYDKDADDVRCHVVAIRIDRAEWVLKPFVDAILTKHGAEAEPAPELDDRVIRRFRTMSVPSSANPIELEPEYLPSVTYNPQSHALLIENGEPGVVSETIALDVVIFYDKDVDNARTSAVAIRIDSAERVLKPFVDAVLAKHGVTPDQRAAVKETKM